MEININNYEAFFLDYYEGKLSNEQTEKLFHFLEQHPELKEDFSSYENIILEKEPIFFENKNSLIKPEVTHHNYENYLIAEAEDDLNVNEKRALDNFLTQHPEYNKDRALYAKIKAAPDENVIFNLKEKLKKIEKKPVAKIIYLYRSVAVAASLILAIFFFTQINKTDKTGPVAEIKTESKQGTTKEKNEEVKKVKDASNEVKYEKELKPNIADAKTITNNYSNQANQNDSAEKEEPENLQIAIVEPKKSEPDLSNEMQELPKAPVPEIAEAVQSEVKEVPQPTLAQAAINTVEKLISENQQSNEAQAATSVVELAANGLNKLAGKELVSFEKKYNEEGQLKKIQFTAGNFGFSRSKSR